MRILHVANFNTSRYGTDLYATDRKISAGLIENGHFVYNFSYRDVCRNQSLFKTTKLGRSKLQKKLITACENIHPHLLLLGHTELIQPETLKKIRQKFPGQKTALWYVDALFHTSKMVHIKNRLDSLDVFFATTGGELLKEYADQNRVAAFIPNMVHPAVECMSAFQHTAHDYDFIFCGRDSADVQRQRFMEELNRRAGTFLRCAFKGCLGNRAVTGYDYLHLLQRSRMALNTSRRNDVKLYSSDRIAQLLGNGLLTFSPRVPGQERLFSEKELVYFDNMEELIDKLRFFHNNDRELRSIAARGRQVIHQLCNARRVTAYMLEVIFSTPFSSCYEWAEEQYGGGTFKAQEQDTPPHSWRER